jgi:hypothetical protein
MGSKKLKTAAGEMQEHDVEKRFETGLDVE